MDTLTSTPTSAYAALAMGLIHVTMTLRRVETVEPSYEADFLVDTGATDSMAPARELRRIGLEPVGTMAYELTDGSLREYAFGLARIEFMGEVTAGRVLFGPDGSKPLLGVTALKSVGITVDPASGTLKRLPTIPLKSIASPSWRRDRHVLKSQGGRRRRGPVALRRVS